MLEEIMLTTSKIIWVECVYLLPQTFSSIAFIKKSFAIFLNKFNVAFELDNAFKPKIKYLNYNAKDNMWTK